MLDDASDELAAREAERHRDDPTVGMADVLADLFEDDGTQIDETHHARWKLASEKKVIEASAEPSETDAERAEIRLAMASAKAVYDRRRELGRTQAQLADRAHLTRTEISRIEGADAVPTLPLLRRLAAAMNASLNITLDADHEEITFTEYEPLDETAYLLRSPENARRVRQAIENLEGGCRHERP
ncbi:hypothetical protein GCM10010431_08680 [Streptomyces kunmingensis]